MPCERWSLIRYFYMSVTENLHFSQICMHRPPREIITTPDRLPATDTLYLACGEDTLDVVG